MSCDMPHSSEHVVQLLEQPFARLVAVGKHVEWSRQSFRQVLQQPFVVVGEQRGRGNGNSLMSSRQHSQAIGHPLRDEERFPLLKQPQHRQVVHRAPCPLREFESLFSVACLAQVSALHAKQSSVDVAVGNEQRRRAVLNVSDGWLSGWNGQMALCLLTLSPSRSATPSMGRLASLLMSFLSIILF